MVSAKCTYMLVGGNSNIFLMFTLKPWGNEPSCRICFKWIETTIKAWYACDNWCFFVSANVFVSVPQLRRNPRVSYIFNASKSYSGDWWYPTNQDMGSKNPFLDLSWGLLFGIPKTGTPVVNRLMIMWKAAHSQIPFEATWVSWKWENGPMEEETGVSQKLHPSKNEHGTKKSLNLPGKSSSKLPNFFGTSIFDLKISEVRRINQLNVPGANRFCETLLKKHPGTEGRICCWQEF